MDQIKLYPLVAPKAIANAIRAACVANGVPSLAKEIKVAWCDKRVQSVGAAYLNRKLIKLSTKLMSRVDKDEQLETVVHETCHIIAYVVNQHKGHDQPWKDAMIRAGYEPKRYHNIYNDDLRRPPEQTDFTFDCACRKDFQIGPRRAKKAVAGKMNYYCKTCMEKLRLSEAYLAGCSPALAARTKGPRK